ncbi:MAG: hypothetical protein HZB61_10815 [Nitrospirae bacterium]|nr:hypothetical protein [Nitrospirota bacterium]
MKNRIFTMLRGSAKRMLGACLSVTTLSPEKNVKDLFVQILGVLFALFVSVSFCYAEGTGSVVLYDNQSYAPLSPGSAWVYIFTVTGLRNGVEYNCGFEASTLSSGEINFNGRDGSNQTMPVASDMRFFYRGTSDELGRIIVRGVSSVELLFPSFYDCSMAVTTQNDSKLALGIFFGFVFLGLFLLAVR